MPRNVVTVLRRRSLLPRRSGRRERQDLVLLQLRERYRARPRPAGDGIQIDFPKKIGRREARARVLEDLDRIEPDWRRLFAVYPKERSLREEPR